ncbi:MAG TPA: PAS domain S-box protein [Microvirga sp.]|jgi:PAS domain S-box-containing protein
MAQPALQTFELHAPDPQVGAALAVLGIGVAGCDTDLRYTWFAGASPSFLGPSAIGLRDDEILAAADAADLLAVKQRALATGQAQAAHVRLSHGGQEFCLELRAQPVLDAGRVAGLTLAMLKEEALAQPPDARGERERILAATTREAVLLHDGQRTVEANEAFCRLLGFTRDEAIDRDPMDFVAPESRDFVVKQAERRAKGPDELFLSRKDGTSVPVEVLVERFEEGGRILRVARIRDLTMYKRAEAALREGEARYRALAAATREGVIIHDGERIVEVNEAFCQLHGTTRERAIGRAAYDYIAPEARPDALAIIASGRSTIYETTACREDGSTFPVEAAGQPILYRGRLMRVATLRDLSERRVAEGALRDSEERFRSFAEASADVLWVADAVARRLEYLSPAFKALWGEDPDAVIQRPSRWFELLHPDDHALVAGAFERTARGERMELEYRIIRPDGEVRWIRDTGFPIRGPDGSIRRVGGLARDITRRKEDETRQRLLLGELNHRVKNTLATVQSIARQTLRHAEDPAVFQERFEDRLLALSQTHNLLTSESWERASLRALLKQELAPYGKARCRYDGPADVHLAPRAVVALGMALHELTTNAAKYGALSVETGRVTLDWSVSGGLFERLRLEWREEGGPPIAAPPARRGFGSRLLERGITAELGGTVDLDFAPEGLRAVIELPLDRSNVPEI